MRIIPIKVKINQKTIISNKTKEKKVILMMITNTKMIIKMNNMMTIMKNKNINKNRKIILIRNSKNLFNKIGII